MKRLPVLWFFTDPDRTPDPAAVAVRLPRGSGVVFRGFGRLGAAETAAQLAMIARRRGLVLLIGADEDLAVSVGADGVHLPERDLVMARRLRARHPRWLITGAVHSPRALAKADAAGLDAVFLSAVFPSNSPSARAPLGPLRFSLLAREAATPVIALGGVNGRTAARLAQTRAAGIAAVEGWLKP